VDLQRGLREQVKLRRALWLLAVLACQGPPPDPNAQTAFVRFAVTDQVRNSPYLMRPPVGTTYGNIYHNEDITISGPRDGVVGLDLIEMPLDLTSGMSDAGHVTPKLEPGKYTYLGFLDTNDSGYVIDKGDVAMLPTDNQFEIVDGGPQIPFTIMFTLIYN
jgi:hypothetical protein